MGNIFQKYECFGIDVSEVPTLFEFPKNIKTIRRQDTGSRLDIADPKVINADPFLFVYKEKLFLFYEETTFRRTGGRLMMICTADLKNWSEPIQISKDNSLHFSFPYVFEADGEVYMLPETGWGGEIRLYKATNPDLTDFELDSVLMKRKDKDENIIFDFADNVLYRKDCLWYLFTSILDKNGYQLHLYTSKDLRGPYKPHPASPVCHSLKFGRNAGSLIECDGLVFRPSQDCSKTYGGQVNILRVIKLTPDEYEEEIFKENVIPSNIKFFRHGGHQLNYVTFKGKLLVALDAKRDRSFPLLRIVDKLKKFF